MQHGREGALYGAGAGTGPGGRGGGRGAGGLRDRPTGARWSAGAATGGRKSRPRASHAEMEAIAQANAALGSWRLEDCELYVTLEPCPMCAGAILNARIPRVCYGARDAAFGACGGVTNLFMEAFPNRPALVGGILAEECREVLSAFFGQLRQRREQESPSGRRDLRLL